MKNRILASALALVLATGMAVSAAAEIPSSPITSHKVSKIPVIDGKYDENEGWGEPVTVIDSAKMNDYTSDAAYYGDKTLQPESVKAYLRWDADHLYFCAVVVDPIHYNDNAPEDYGSAWAGDGFQFDIKSLADEDTANRNRTFYGLTNEGKYCINVDMVEAGSMAEIAGGKGLWTANAITRDEATKTTVYETAWDLATALPDGSVLEGDELLVRPILLCTKDAATEDIVDINFAGIDAGSYLYWKVSLAGIPEAEVVEDVAAAPATFDAGVIAAVAAIVSAAGYAIAKKH